MLGDVIAMEEKSIRELRNYSFCCDLHLDVHVRCFGAVRSRNGELVNRNDYIAFRDEEEEV